MPQDIIAPRSNTTQQVNFERRQIKFGESANTKLIGSIPLNSVITEVGLAVGVGFNAASVSILLGVTPGGAELMAAADNTPATPGYYKATRALGIAATQASPPANNVGDPQGGTPLYLTVTQGAANAAPAGFAYLVVAYIPPLPEAAVAGGI